MSSQILTFQCPDRAGIQAAVATLLFNHKAFLIEVTSHSATNGRFFSRSVFAGDQGAILNIEAIRRDFAALASKFDMEWELVDASRKMRTVIAVSKFGHCLNDLLHRWQLGVLPIDIRAVVSNHPDMRALTEWHGLPFIHIPVTKETKAEAETAMMRVIEDHDAELLVLARYMQVLSDDLARKMSGRCINIHHSFLPSFKGAKPYHQAHERGVKIIGATAHYVTSDLDEGPIIEQDIERIDHKASPEDMVDIGRDIEARVLARAVRWHAEHRILLNGRRTVVFR